MSNQSAARLNASVDEYVELASTKQINSKLFEFLVDDPSSWVGFHAIAAALESEGDTAAAAECYLGRIPDYIQQRIFNENVSEFTKQKIDSDRSVVHEASSKTPRSSSVQNTIQLSQYKNNNLIAAPTSIIRYNNVNLWYDGFNTVISDSNGAVDKDTLVGNLAPAIQASRRTPAKHITGKVVLMGCLGSNNFYHWMTDLLPKFAILEKSGIKIDSQTKYVFNNVTSNLQIETLKDFGLSDNQIVQTVSQGRHIHADELIVPVLSNSMGLTMGEWLPEFMREKYGPKKASSRSKKILVTRSAAATQGKRIHNLAEFNDYFMNHGYEILSPESHTIAEQAQLFSEATSVVGPHGAALTNLIFCQPNTRVYEFYGEHYAPSFWAVSELSDLDYVNQKCVSYDPSKESELAFAKSLGDRRSSSFSVNIAELKSDFV